MDTDINKTSEHDLSSSQLETDHNKGLTLFLNYAVNRLHERLEPWDFRVSQRTAEDYKKLLDLDRTKIVPGAEVLDVGSGRTSMQASGFSGNIKHLVCTDLMPELSSTKKENMLKLSFPDNSFDEVWTMFAFRYIDPYPPIQVLYAIGDMLKGTKMNDQKRNNCIRLVNGLLGLVALGELFRVTKPGGRIRIGSYLRDFDFSSAIATVMSAIGSDQIAGLSLESKNIIEEDRLFPGDSEANFIFRKESEYDKDRYQHLINNFWIRIPDEARDSILSKINSN